MTKIRPSSFRRSREIAEPQGNVSPASESLRILEQVIATLPVGVVVTDSGGNIVTRNPAAARIWGRAIVSGPERWRLSVGRWHDTGQRISAHEWASARALRYGQTSVDELVDIETFDGARKIIRNSAAPLRDPAGGILGAVIVNEDVTERVASEDALRASHAKLRALSVRLESALEDERTRIAREIHDDLGQALTALRIDLEWVREHSAVRPVRAGAPRRKLAEMTATVDHLLTGVQRLATELRPAALDQLGVDNAIRWLATDFERRTGITCRVAVADELAPSCDAMPSALFRIAQEALTNVARHAGATHVDIELRSNARAIHLTVRDDGRGITDAEAGGPFALGILGMRERAVACGGSLAVHGVQAPGPAHGTEVAVSLPVCGPPRRGRRMAS